MRYLIDFLAGWVGGALGLIVGHPVDTIKVRQQNLNETLPNTVLKTLKHEGIFGFYKGMLVPLFTIGISNAVFFGAYSYSLEKLHGPPTAAGERVNLDNPNWAIHVTLAGFYGGIVQALVTCPAEVVKTLLQLRTGACKNWNVRYMPPYKNNTEAIAGIYKEFGIRGFYRGFAPMFVRDAPTSGIWMYVYEYLRPKGEDNIPQQILAAGLAGIASWIFTIPFDFVKTKLQSDNPHNPKYKGTMHCFRLIYKERGWRAFFRGFWLVTARSFPVNVAILGGYEVTQKFLNSKLQA